MRQLAALAAAVAAVLALAALAAPAWAAPSAGGPATVVSRVVDEHALVLPTPGHRPSVVQRANKLGGSPVFRVVLATLASLAVAAIGPARNVAGRTERRRPWTPRVIRHRRGPPCCAW